MKKDSSIALVWDCYLTNNSYSFPESVTISLSEKDLEYYRQVALMLRVLEITTCSWDYPHTYNFVTKNKQSYFWPDAEELSTIIINDTEYAICDVDDEIQIERFNLILYKDGDIFLAFDIGEDIKIHTNGYNIYSLEKF